MICPKCGKEMKKGAIGPNGRTTWLYWAEDDYFRDKIINFTPTKRKAEKDGAVIIPVRNGVTQDRTGAWACKDCSCVLIDCN